MAQFREFAMTQKFEEMKCEQIAGLLPDYLHGKLQPEQTSVVKAHLEQCAACGEEAAIWSRGRLSKIQREYSAVSPALSKRWNINNRCA